MVTNEPWCENRSTSSRDGVSTKSNHPALLQISARVIGIVNNGTENFQTFLRKLVQDLTPRMRMLAYVI